MKLPIREEFFRHASDSLCFLPSAGDRFVQLCRQLDDCAEHQAEPLHRARPPVRHQVHLHCQGHQPGGEPQQRAGETQDQQYG